MSLDPRNVPTSPDAQVAQRLADLERRVAALERVPIQVTTATAGTPVTPTETTTTADSGTTIRRLSSQPKAGSSVVNTGDSRAYFWTGSSWKYVSLT
jgi:hypothetical protein